MSELPPASFPEGAPPPEPVRGVASRVFWRVFLVVALVPFGLIALGNVLPGSGDALVSIGVLSVVAAPVLCILVAIVLAIQDRREAAKGWLLAGLAAPVVGFGSCLLGLMTGV